ncbi:MAG: hypothetical protein ACLFPD_08080 [Desulfosudaceae bacterium]
MSKAQGLVVIFIASAAMIIGGLRGIIKRDVVADQAHFILSVWQLIAGLIGSLFFIIVYFGIITW